MAIGRLFQRKICNSYKKIIGYFEVATNNNTDYYTVTIPKVDKNGKTITTGFDKDTQYASVKRMYLRKFENGKWGTAYLYKTLVDFEDCNHSTIDQLEEQKSNCIDGIYTGGVYPVIVLIPPKTFFRRFFSQQFKRSCLPDGPKVGSVAVSPRGDLRMPSDAMASLWLEELEKIQ